MAMRKPLMGALLMMAMACVVRAQDGNWTDNSAKDCGSGTTATALGSPVAQVNLAAAAATRNFALATPEASSANASAPAADPGAAPAATPKYVFGERDDYRWQLALGVEFFRFQSNLINASMVGLNTTVTYFTNDWFALEGNLVTGFAPQIYDREHVKYFGGGGGNSNWNTQGEIRALDPCTGRRRALTAANGGKRQGCTDSAGGNRVGLPGARTAVAAGRNGLRVQRFFQADAEQLSGGSGSSVPLLSGFHVVTVFV